MKAKTKVIHEKSNENLQKNAKTSTKITKNTLIGEIVDGHPNAVKVLNKMNVECVGCHVAMWETVEQVAQEYNIDVDFLLNELNK